MRPESWLLELFDAAGAMVADFSTDSAHPRPYLHPPVEGVATTADYVSGKVKGGQVNVRLQDRRRIASAQETGFFTQLLALHAGLNGYRARLTYTPDGTASEVVTDGVVSTPRLVGFTDFEFAIKDELEQAEAITAFTRNGTVCVFPRGPLADYGRLPNGSPMVPAVVPAQGVYRQYSGSISGGTGGGCVDIDGSTFGGLFLQPARVLTGAGRDVAAAEWTDGSYVLKKIEVWWRAAGSGAAWTKLVNMPMPRVQILTARRVVGLFETVSATVRTRSNGEEAEERVGLIDGVRLFPTPGGTLPAHNQRVELLVVYVGPASPAWPFLWEGTAGEYARRMLSLEWTEAGEGVPRAPRLDATAFAGFQEPCRAYATAPVKDARAHLAKEWCQPLSAALTPDLQGRISPTRNVLPDSTAALIELNELNSEPLPQWGHEDELVINRSTFVYSRDRHTPVTEDPLAQASSHATVSTETVRIHGEPVDASIARFGPKQDEVVTALFRGAAGAAGQAFGGEADLKDEIGYRLGLERTRQRTDRYAYGVQRYALRVRRSVSAVLRHGDWVLVTHKALPDYVTGERGINRIAQVLGLQRLSPSVIDVSLEDGGDNIQPLAAPSAAPSLTLAADGAVEITYAFSGVAGVQMAVETAVTAAGAAQPPANSGAWLPLDRLSSSGTLRTPPPPAGVRIWVRSRHVGVQRRPSAWVGGGSTLIPSEPRLLAGTLAVDRRTGETVYALERNPYAQGVRIFYAQHAAGETPSVLGSFADCAPAASQVTLPVVPGYGGAVTVQAEPWSGWTGVQVAGMAGPRLPPLTGVRDTAAERPPAAEIAPAPTQLSASRTELVLRYSGALGPGGTGTVRWRRRIIVGGASTPWPATYNDPGATSFDSDEVVGAHYVYPKRVELEVIDGAGIASYDDFIVDPAFPAIGSGGGLAPAVPWDGAGGLTPADTIDGAIAGAAADADLASFEAGGVLSREDFEIYKLRDTVGARDIFATMAAKGADLLDPARPEKLPTTEIGAGNLPAGVNTPAGTALSVVEADARVGRAGNGATPGNVVRNWGGKGDAVGAVAADWTKIAGTGVDLTVIAVKGAAAGQSNTARIPDRFLAHQHGVTTNVSYHYGSVAVSDGQLWQIGAWLAAYIQVATGGHVALLVGGVGCTVAPVSQSHPLALGNVPVEVGLAKTTTLDWTWVWSLFRVVGSGTLNYYLHSTGYGEAYFDGVEVVRIDPYAPEGRRRVDTVYDADGVIRSTSKVRDTSVTARPVANGLRVALLRNGESVVFDPPYQDRPTVVGYGPIPKGPTAGNAVEIGFSSLGPGGGTFVAQQRSITGTATARQKVFSDVGGTPRYQANKDWAGEAEGGGQYLYRVTYTVNAISVGYNYGVIEIGLWYNTGSGWQLYDTITRMRSGTPLTTTEDFPVVVSGMPLNADFGVSLASTEGDGGSIAPVHVSWTEIGGAGAPESLTPAGFPGILVTFAAGT